MGGERRELGRERVARGLKHLVLVNTIVFNESIDWFGFELIIKNNLLALAKSRKTTVDISHKNISSI